MDALATPWSLPVDEALSRLGADRQAGLNSEQVAARLNEHGPNELRAAKPRNRLLVFLSQFADVMVGLLTAAALISGVVGEWKDALLILLIVVVNAVIGYVHEERAESAVAQLKKLTQPSARVWRDGRLEVVPVRDLVPGDVIEILAGGIIPADCRIVAAAELQVDESPLTGESLPVEKSPDPVASAASVADRTSMLHAGTAVAKGRAVAVVTATGMGTELGQIADLLSTASSGVTPLGQQMNELSRKLAVVVTIVCIVVFVTGLLREPLGWQAMFLVAVSLAVAAIPEGLPAVITIALSLGSQRMAARHAIVRQLSAVETLGSVNVICSDKTGTLTQNRMAVADCLPAKESPNAEQALFEAAILCNDAQVSQSGELVGSGTESALLAAAAERGWQPAKVRKMWPREQEFPFDSQRKRMSTAHRGPEGRLVVFVKGSAESVLERSTQFAADGGTATPLSDEERRRLQQRVDELATMGRRVLGLARRELPDGRLPKSADEAERELVLLGFVGLADPIRPEATAAIAECRSAGIRVAMLTGDHPETARSIAGELGILGGAGQADSGELVTGAELDAIDDEQLAERAPRVAVYARVSPAHKLRIVRALQSKDQVVAMTGDGVNDAPALKQADIGIAMGVTGTDVSKEAARMVLADDNFATIVAAVEEGRVVYDNIRKFIRYLLASNLGEILLLFVAIVMGLPVPLLPVQLLWINLVTDGLPAVALAFEPTEPGAMSRPPRRRTDSIFAGGLLRRIVLTSVVMMAACLGVYIYFLGGLATVDAATAVYARTAAFATAALFQLFLVLGLRHVEAPFWKYGLRGNYRLTLAVLAGLVLQVLIIYVPPLASLFHTVPLSFTDLDIVVVVALTGLVAVEIEKWFIRRASR